jgi:superfamily II DNA or RNA helicase
MSFSLVNSIDRYLDKNQDGVNVRRETPWISTIRGPASRLESLKTVPKTSNARSKAIKKNHDSSDSESGRSYSSSDSESSFSDDSSDSYDNRGRRGKKAAPQVRSSSRLKGIGNPKSSKHRGDSSSESEYSDSEASSRTWQPPKSRAQPKAASSAGRKKQPVIESEDISDFDSESASSAVSDPETDVEEAADLVVDKILAKRKIDDHWEYLVKWRCRSYKHCEWMTGRDLSIDYGSDKRSVKLKNFNSKNQGASMPTFERGYFYNPMFETVERILAVRNLQGSPQYLVKWSGLPYSESTWESESALSRSEFGAAMSEFERLNDENRCDIRFKTNSRDSYGRVIGRQFDPTSDFAHCLTAVPSNRALDMTAENLPMEYEYVPEGRSLVADSSEPPFRIFDFQKEGISWLLYNWSQARGCILADEMGLGKTVQTSVTLAQMSGHCRAHGGGPLTHLIIAPLSTIEQWRREIKKWTDLEPVVYHGSRRDRNVIHKYEWDGRVDYSESLNGETKFVYRATPSFMPKFDVLITTFETISGEPEVFNAPDFVWSVVVIDEAHKLKSSDGKARTSVMQIPCRHRILLTGTPIQNNVGELWNLLHLCAPSIWDDQESFLSEFGALNSAELTQRLQDKIQPFLLQRRKADVLAHLMPAKEETIVSVELTRLQKETYRAVYEKNISLLTGPKKTVPALTNIHMELRKCCNHPFLVAGVEERVTHELVNDYTRLMEYLINSSGKMVFLDKLLEKLRRERSKILIFSQFTMMLDLIEDYLRWRQYSFERLDGAVKGQQRQEAVDRFNRTQEDESGNGSFVFLLSTKAGGVGLNLTAANYVLLFDHDWNPQNDLQAQARCHRIGQTKEVQIFRLVTRGTYEEKMFQVASQKLGLEQAVMSGGSDAKGSRLSKEELDRLLKEGAYAMLENDEDEAKFCAENVDEILRNRARTVSTFVAGSNSGGFSKARFQVNQEDDVDINDPNFWAKMASLGSLAPAQTAVTEDFLDYSQRRGRAQFGQKKLDYSSLDDDEEEEGSEFSESEETTAKKRAPPPKDKTEEARLKRMKLILRFVLSYGLNENKELFDSRFRAMPEYDAFDDIEIALPAFADHLLLIASLYVLSRSGSSGLTKFDEVHFCPTVRAAVGLLAQFRSTGTTPPASLEPLLLDGMMPDLQSAIERLDLTIPVSIVPNPLPRIVTEAVPRNRNAKKLVMEIDLFNEIRFHVKNNGALLRKVAADKGLPTNWSREDDVELLKLYLEHGKENYVARAIEKFNQRTNEVVSDLKSALVSRPDKILPKISLVRSFQLFLVINSFGLFTGTLDRALKASGYPWVRKFACGESLIDMMADSDPPITSLLTQVAEIPPETECPDEATFLRFLLLQLPPDSPMSTFDVSDYAKALLYRTISALGKKSDKHDSSVKTACKPTKTNENLFESVSGVTALYPQRDISRIEAFKIMWRFQTVHFIRSTSLQEPSTAVSTFVCLAKSVGLDRWELVTNLNRHLKPSNCLQSLMLFVCKSLIEADAAAKNSPVATLEMGKKRKTSPTESGDEQTKVTKLTDFFAKKHEEEIQLD